MKLALLLEEARTASPAERIAWRDRIAAHGPEAIDGVKPWLADPTLAGFAVRVIERAGIEGERTYAARILRSARKAASATVARDIDWALQRLRDKPAPPQRAPARPSATPMRAEARRTSSRRTL
jgi:hypothetical protein